MPSFCGFLSKVMFTLLLVWSVPLRSSPCQRVRRDDVSCDRRAGCVDGAILASVRPRVTGALGVSILSLAARWRAEEPCDGSFRDGGQQRLVGRERESCVVASQLTRSCALASMSLVLDKYDVMDEEQSMKYFSFFFGLSQFFGGLAVLLVAIWMGSYGGGFGWTESPEQQFHYHPLFMVIGLIFLYGEAMMVYRVFRHERKKFTKLLHVVIHSMIFVFFVVALKAVFDSHNLNVDASGQPAPIPNLYSTHSWVGFTTVILFCMQYVCGFVSFFFPGLSLGVRQWYLPIHQLAGMVIFVMAVMSALMGLSERAAWHNTCWTKEKRFCGEQGVTNMLGVSILLYAICVIFLVANPRWRRRSLPEEESLQPLTAD
uniref:Cytochrome b561 domain-containing protein n=1 Tax=Plectus sambesii TaxID=2011161 RepID=A0A914V2U1_9BILA